MRGQKLFIRPIEAGDRDAIRAFLDKEAATAVAPAFGLLGKLVGELVGVVEIQVTSDAIEVDNIVVARDLRRKHIGRFLLDEVEQLAVKMERQRLIVRCPADAEQFLERTGFEREGARWIRYVRSQGAKRASR